MLDEGGFAQVDTIFGGGRVVQFLNNVNSGLSFVNYRGTGWDMGWSGIEVYSSTINNGKLVNTNTDPTGDKGYLLTYILCLFYYK